MGRTSGSGVGSEGVKTSSLSDSVSMQTTGGEDERAMSAIGSELRSGLGPTTCVIRY